MEPESICVYREEVGGLTYHGGSDDKVLLASAYSSYLVILIYLRRVSQRLEAQSTF